MPPMEDFPPEFQPYLMPTKIIDSDHPLVKEYALHAAKGATSDVDAAVKLYLAVRDNIRYDPYSPFHLPEHYRASRVLQRGKHFCIPKASLLCALARALSIPGRLGFASVRNHLATRQLLEFLGSDLFVYHAFTELYLDGKWVKATPAFNLELCERHQVPALDFNGREDSLFQPYNEESRRFMEYVEFIGTYADVPVEEILSAWKRTYGADRVQGWIRTYEEGKGESIADFGREEVHRG